MSKGVGVRERRDPLSFLPSGLFAKEREENEDRETEMEKEDGEEREDGKKEREIEDGMTKCLKLLVDVADVPVNLMRSDGWKRRRKFSSERKMEVREKRKRRKKREDAKTSFSHQSFALS